MTEPVALKPLTPFAEGGHRSCYVAPWDRQLCIKVRRPDYPLTALRRSKGFPKNLKPLSAFDDNREEHRVLQSFQRHYGDAAFAHIVRSHGFIDTDLGPGLVLELIRNGDGRIARTLKEELWEWGATEEIDTAVEALIAHWSRLRIPSRHLLLHNLVVQRDDAQRVRRLVVIDGLGNATLIPFHWLPGALQKRRVERKVTAFRERIQALLDLREQQSAFPGKRGLLHHRDAPKESS